LTQGARRGPAPSALQAALKGACPRCGRGRLFAGFLTLAPACTVCGLDLSSADSGDGPAVFLIFIVGTIAVVLAIWLEVALAPPLWVHAVVSGLVVMALSLLLLRPAKALMVALQWRHRGGDFEPGEG
jgi:uncharacterized protein (DUF983 family)